MDDKGGVDGEAIYRAWYGTTEAWGGCADRERVGRVLDLIHAESRREREQVGQYLHRHGRTMERFGNRDTAARDAYYAEASSLHHVAELVRDGEHWEQSDWTEDGEVAP